MVDSTDLLKLLLTHSKIKALAGAAFLCNINKVNTANNWAKSIDHTTAQSGAVIDSGRGNIDRSTDAMQIDSNLIKRRAGCRSDGARQARGRCRDITHAPCWQRDPLSIFIPLSLSLSLSPSLYIYIYLNFPLSFSLLRYIYR